MSYVIQELCQEIGDLKHALAEKDRKISTLKHDYAQLKEAYDAKVAGVPLGPIVGTQTIINQQIAYQQLMEQAVRFAENVVHSWRWQEHEWNEAVKFVQSPEVHAWKEQG